MIVLELSAMATEGYSSSRTVRRSLAVVILLKAS